MRNSRPSFLRRLVPANFRDPIGLARRILSSRDPAAYFAVASTALAALATPFDALLAATMERRALGDTVPQRPVILVTGAPRSGTTVLSQALIHHLPVAYFNNLTAVFPRAPISANRLLRRFLAPPKASLHSFYGRTSGFASENDGLHLWDRWLGSDRYVIPQHLDPAAAADLRRFFGAYERTFGRPILNKNNALATGCSAIAEALPSAHFIFIRRDPVFTVQSILGARETIQGTREAPYGVNDPTRRQAGVSAIADVCGQVLYHERRMLEQQREIGERRFWIVDYEQFCIEPHVIVARVGREILGVEVDTNALKAALPPLHNTNRSKLSSREIEEIRTMLARLRAPEPARGSGT